LKVMVLGVRGIPNVQGGVETHAEQLYTRLAKLGCDVEVIVRSPYVNAEQQNVGPIRLLRLWSPTTPGFEALVHSLLGVVYAGFRRPDILHIHAVGPAAVTPLARLMGLKVVVTHHGPDYDRDRWGGFARALLHFGEWAGMRFSNARIVISRVIQDLVKTKQGCDSVLIPNGVVPIEPPAEDDAIRGFGLEPGKYFLLVSRVVPEKRQLDLINAYVQARPAGWRLALVGGLGDDDYSRRVRAAAEEAGVVVTGFLSGAPLQQMYAHAGAFVLPSTHEGLPIAMLEALSYGLPVIASDIPANLEVGLPAESYFPVGNVDSLSNLMKCASFGYESGAARLERRRWVAVKYNWDDIASQTRSVYVTVAGA
jgi:glycosyltransferase involved in cell wall biosynthesis